jgi:hypothetical protein
VHQDPERLHRIEPRIFVRVRPSSRFLDSCAFLASHPLRSPRESFFLSKGGTTATRYPFASKSALRLLSWLAGEILLSDFCNQLSDTSTREPLDSRVEGSRLPTRCSLHCSVTKTPCGSSVSGGGRLDGAPPTSAVSLTALPRKNRPRGDTSPRRCQPRAKPMTGLWRSLSPPDSILVSQEVIRTLGPLPTWFASTKQACSARSAFSRQVPGDPLYASSQTRHRALDFATEEPASEVFSRPNALALSS